MLSVNVNDFSRRNLVPAARGHGQVRSYSVGSGRGRRITVDLLVPCKTPPLQFEASYLELDDDEEARLKSEQEKPLEPAPNTPPESGSTLET